MPDRLVGSLVEIEDAINSIRTYTSGLDQASFMADQLRCDATAMQLIVIGEAANQIPDDVLGKEAPEIPWANIVGLRNRIAHGYRSVDYGIVWNVTQQHLAPLGAAVRRMLAARGE